MGYLSNNTVVKSLTRGEDSRTRDQVARAILESGPSTAATLAAKLKMTPAGIRRHLESLIDEGILEEREPHQRSVKTRGRPAKVFVMSDNGRERFEHSYDDLAVSALKFLSSQGEHLVSGFAKHRADEIVKKAGIPSESREKARALAKFLSAEGYAATTHAHGIGIELCQHHCPIAHVASEFPQLCEEETRAFSQILGTHVQRLATIAHGDGVCTTFVPQPPTVRERITKR
jgi:predicted ArsR family transcriptional regulator